MTGLREAARAWLDRSRVGTHTVDGECAARHPECLAVLALDAQDALDRVQALADDWERAAGAHDPAYRLTGIAADLRRALDGPAQDADPFKPPYPCPTERCSGDGRYAPPGRGHDSDCAYLTVADGPAQAAPRPPHQEGNTDCPCVHCAAFREDAPAAQGVPLTHKETNR